MSRPAATADYVRHVDDTTADAPLRDERSDAKFIEWSAGTTTRSFDVVALAARIADLPSGPVRVLDIGGGIGAFALALVEACSGRDVRVTVLDPSVSAVPHRRVHPSVDYVTGTIDAHLPDGPFDMVVLRTVVHHFVARRLPATDRTQADALARVRGLLAPGGTACVVENLYEPMIGVDTTGRLIFRVTANRLVALPARLLGANTAGEGVRFRSRASWLDVYRRAGLDLVEETVRPRWGANMPAWQRWPLLCRSRRQVLHVLAARPA